MSLTAQIEILQIMALKVLRGIESDISESGYYSIMADKSTDESNLEQLVTCICWVVKEMALCNASCSDKWRYNCCLHQRCAACI